MTGPLKPVPISKKTGLEPITYEMTIRMDKLAYHRQPRKRVPAAIRKLCRFAARMMNTRVVKLCPQANNVIWARGVKYPPKRIRLRFYRKRSEVENATEPFFTLIKHVECADFNFLQTEIVHDDQE